jgi:hypothetical protein
VTGVPDLPGWDPHVFERMVLSLTGFLQAAGEIGHQGAEIAVALRKDRVELTAGRIRIDLGRGGANVYLDDRQAARYRSVAAMFLRALDCDGVCKRPQAAPLVADLLMTPPELQQAALSPPAAQPVTKQALLRLCDAARENPATGRLPFAVALKGYGPSVRDMRPDREASAGRIPHGIAMDGLFNIPTQGPPVPAPRH